MPAMRAFFCPETVNRLLILSVEITMKTPSYTFSNSWALVVLRALDVFFACCIWRDYNITISSWCGLELRKENPKRWAKILGKILDKIQEGHCEIAIKTDIERIQVSLDILNGNYNK
jgi:hypothetical protein